MNGEQMSPAHPAGGALTARQEWRSMWQIPITAMLGIGGISAFTYSNGVFIGEMTKEFGWTRAEFSLGQALALVAGISCGWFAGRLVDKTGPRRILLFAIVPHILLLAALGAVSGPIWQFWLLCMVQGLVAAFVAPAVWLSAVVGRFHASRGLAVGTAQAGIGVAAMLWPILSAYYVQTLGWRGAFPALAGTFGVIILPMLVLFFYGAKDRGARVTPASVEAPTPTPTPAASPAKASPVWPALRSQTFFFVTIAAALFSSVTLGLNLHMIPLLQDKGFDLTTAALVTSAMGLATFAGRLFTGFLLDLFSIRLIGCISFLVPIITALILLYGGSSLPVCLAAAIIFGLASGAEADVITLIVSRKMPDIFATMYAIIISFVGPAAAFGPVLAGKLYDIDGSYTLYLWLVIPAVTIGAVLIALLPPIPKPARAGTMAAEVLE